MKICIIGAGAIGGFIGTRLAASDQAQVSALARGATLANLRQHGWRLQMNDSLIQAPAVASDRAADLGVQDLVIVAVKATAMPDVARGIAPLLGEHTLVMPAMNGVPWWFCDVIPGWSGAPLQSVDPAGAITEAIATSKVVGCVVHASASSPEPGLVQHKMGKGLIVGEPRGGKSDRVHHLANLLTDAGFDVTHSDNIRYDIWYKLWGNMTMNPVSALTGGTGDRILGDPLVRAFCSAAMTEAAVIGDRIGCSISQTPEDRHLLTEKLGAFKTSMLQDVEAGRPIELDAIVGVVRELGGRLGVTTPNIDALLGLTRLFARTRGLYPGAS